MEIRESKWQEGGENYISSSFMIPKIIQKISEQHTWKARHQRTTENIHTGHSTRTSESINGKEQNFFFRIV